MQSLKHFIFYLDILLYHVVPHTEYSAGLYNRESLRTLDANHDRLRVHTRGKASYLLTNSVKLHITQLGHICLYKILKERFKSNLRGI